MNNRTVLVIGATGMQGGSAVDALVKANFRVRALVRDPQSSASRSLAARGIGLVAGDLDDRGSLGAAMEGAFGVFSMQNVSPPNDPDREVRHGRNLVEAARAGGITTFVHTSVARAGRQEQFAGWRDGRWPAAYWNGKSGVNDLVRAAGFPNGTILKPAYMLENFLPPKVTGMYPGLKSRVIETAMSPETRLDVIAAGDVGFFAAAAFSDPARFSLQEIDLASAKVTMGEMADAISAATGETIVARTLPAEQLIAKGYFPGLVDSQLWATLEGYQVDLVRASSFGITLESPQNWADRNRERFDFAPHQGARSPQPS